MTPNPAILSDEEGNEDDLNSPTLPRGILGTIEVIARHPNHHVSDWDDSDDLPLANYERPPKRPRNCNSDAPVLQKI